MQQLALRLAPVILSPVLPRPLKVAPVKIDAGVTASEAASAYTPRAPLRRSVLRPSHPRAGASTPCYIALAVITL